MVVIIFVVIIFECAFACTLASFEIFTKELAGVFSNTGLAVPDILEIGGGFRGSGILLDSFFLADEVFEAGQGFLQFFGVGAGLFSLL